MVVRREALQRLLDTRPVPLLEVRIARSIGLRALLGHPHDRHRGTDEPRHDDLVELRVALAMLRMLRDLGRDLVERLAPLRLALRIGRDELAERLLGALLLRREAALHESLELALRVGEHVAEATDVRRGADLRLLVVLRHLLETREVVLVELLATRIRPRHCLVDLGLRLQRVRAPRIAGDEDEVPLLAAVRAPLQVIRDLGRLAVLVGAEEADVEAVAGELEVVGIASEEGGVELGGED